MRYKLLGRSGLRVSELCLGTMTFGEDWGWGATKEESRRIYDAFREAGGNFIDTANMYTNGTSESFLGEFMADHRESVVLGTKYTNSAPSGNDPNVGGNQRKNMMQACEASLRRLKTDYIDLYWLHIWDQITPLEEVMRGFDDLVRQGKILYAGVSDAPAWWIARANAIAELRGWTSFIGLQIEYSLAERTVERELIPMAHALGLTVTAWSPLAGGLLTGKYAKGAAAGARFENPQMAESFGALDQRRRAIAQAVGEVAKTVGRSSAQVALAWLRQRTTPVIPIIGSRKIDQLKDNIACLDLRLDEMQLKKLEESSAIDLGFPTNFYNVEMVRQTVYGGMRDRIDA
ncbi:MAG TPA: aldo/keto reductase [Humisphaera sp.]|jgi:aryl-alcohol dehydrogenase-like predicted oxidoreductase|nr:aldo/keto reductase [Humisphaera sp.]